MLSYWRCQSETQNESKQSKTAVDAGCSQQMEPGEAFHIGQGNGGKGTFNRQVGFSQDITETGPPPARKSPARGAETVPFH
jgi:hypothetical protein